MRSRRPPLAPPGRGPPAAGRHTVLAMDGLELYVRMCFLRHFEERVDVLYRRGLIHGPAHLGLGQEAIALGAASVLRPGDCSLGTYRGHAHALARGAPPDAVLAELLGRAGGICLGWGAAIAAIAAEEAFSDLAAPVARVSGGNVPLPVAASLEAEVDVSAARVVAAARAVLNYR